MRIAFCLLLFSIEEYKQVLGLFWKVGEHKFSYHEVCPKELQNCTVFFPFSLPMNVSFTVLLFLGLALVVSNSPSQWPPWNRCGYGYGHGRHPIYCESQPIRVPWENCDKDNNYPVFCIGSKRIGYDGKAHSDPPALTKGARCCKSRSCDVMVQIKVAADKKSASVKIFDFWWPDEKQPDISDSRVTLFISKASGPLPISNSTSDFPPDVLALKVKQQLIQPLDGTDHRTCASVYQASGECREKAA